MFILKILVKNAFRHKLRTILTVLSITVALVAFGLLRTVIDAWYAGVDASAANRLVTRNAISLVFSLPLSYREKIRQGDGVKRVSYGNWFGGVYIDEKNFFPNFAVEPASYLDMYPEFIVPPDQRALFLRDRRGAIAGRKTAETYGWKIGDIITLKGTIFPGEWDFVLHGIYRGRDRNTDESQFFFHWDYLNERMRKIASRRADQVGFYMIEIRDPDRAADIAAVVDGMFKNSLAETLTETEKAFQMSFIAMTEAILVAIRFVSLVVIAIIMAVTANTMAMTVRERMGEYAVFKTLGFGGWRITGLIFGESLVIAMTGCVIAIIATFPVARGFGDAMGTFFPVFYVTKETFGLYAVAAALVGCVAALIPTWRALGTSIADGLRRIG